MKSTLFLLTLISFSLFAYSSPDLPLSSYTEVEITVLNTFAPDTPSMILGLDYDETNSLLLMGSANGYDPEVYFYDPDDGSYQGEIAYTSPQTNFGVCINDDGSIVYFTEWFQGKLYAYDWSGWTITDSPAGTEGRGMDFRDGYFWVARGLNRDIKRFLPDGSDVSTYSAQQSTENLSGLTTFPLGSNTGVMVTSYYDKSFFFYRFNGSSLTFLTSVEVPLFSNNSLGLAYSDERDSFFWSYTDGATYTISELDIDITVTALQRYSFGHIKTLF